jgi:hypothetical protein
MSKWVVIAVVGLAAACGCWYCGQELWNMVVAMHGH